MAASSSPSRRRGACCRRSTGRSCSPARPRGSRAIPSRHLSPWASSRCAASPRAWRASCRRRASTSLTSWSTAASEARAGPTRPTLPTALSIPTPSPRATCTSSISPAAPGPGRSSCGRGWRSSEAVESRIRAERRIMTDTVTIPALLQMKRDGRKSVGVVAWDYQIARIADRAGVDIVSVGDSVGVNLWGHSNPLEVTMEEMLVVCKAVRRGVTRALVSCDFPYGPLQEGSDSAVRAAIRLVKEGGADMIKLDAAADFPETVRALTRAGIPVFAQFGITPQTALRYGIPYGAQSAPGAQAPPEMTAKLVEEAKLLEDAGAALIDFTNSGPVAGAAVVSAVAIPVLGGFGGGPWLDGRMRMAHTAIGYGEKWIDSKTETYANVAKISLDALSALIADVRAGRQIKG